MWLPYGGSHSLVSAQSTFHTEKMLQQVSMLNVVGISPLRCHCSLPCSTQTCKPNTWVTYFSCSGSLQVNPNCFWCACSQTTGHILSLMNISLIYEEVVLLTTSSCLTMALSIDHMIWGATFNPNPNQLRQYVCPLIFIIWNRYKDLSTWICICHSHKFSSLETMFYWGVRVVMFLLSLEPTIHFACQVYACLLCQMG